MIAALLEAGKLALDEAGRCRAAYPSSSSSSPSKRAPSAIYSSAADISFWDIGLAGQILVKDPALRKTIYSSGGGRGRSRP